MRIHDPLIPDTRNICRAWRGSNCYQLRSDGRTHPALRNFVKVDINILLCPKDPLSPFLSLPLVADAQVSQVYCNGMTAHRRINPV